jgi:hypothetical protein
MLHQPVRRNQAQEVVERDAVAHDARRAPPRLLLQRRARVPAAASVFQHKGAAKELKHRNRAQDKECGPVLPWPTQQALP